MADYRIWGRVEKVRDGFRAVAAASPDQEAVGPASRDVRAESQGTLESCRVALGRLTYELAAALTRRGDRVVWLDVR